MCAPPTRGRCLEQGACELSIHPSIHTFHTHFLCIRVGPKQWHAGKCLTTSPLKRKNCPDLWCLQYLPISMV